MTNKNKQKEEKMKIDKGEFNTWLKTKWNWIFMEYNMPNLKCICYTKNSLRHKTFCDLAHYSEISSAITNQRIRVNNLQDAYVTARDNSLETIKRMKNKEVNWYWAWLQIKDYYEEELSKSKL